MNDNFKYQCSAERAVAEEQAPLGAGSGGGGENTDYKQGDYGISAPTLCFTATGSKGKDARSPVIAILAGGADGAPDGRVAAHGSQGVRITSGPPENPPAANQEIDGIELQVNENQGITIQRGMYEDTTMNNITLDEFLTSVDGGTTEVFIRSQKKITLMVGSGMSSITLTEDSIIVTGLLIQLNKD